MLPLIRTLIDITLLRKGPEHIPRSAVLLFMAVGLWLLSVLIRVVLLGGDEASIGLDLFSALLAISCYAAILFAFRKAERLTQMVTAALGCSALLACALTFLVLVARLLEVRGLEALFFWIYLPWAIAVRGHIIARTIDRHWYLGLMFAVLIFILQTVAIIGFRAS